MYPANVLTLSCTSGRSRQIPKPSRNTLLLAMFNFSASRILSAEYVSSWAWWSSNFPHRFSIFNSSRSLGMYFLLGSTIILPASVQTLVRFRYWHSHLSTFRSETRLEPVAVILWSNHKQAIYVNCDVHTFDLVFIHAVAIPISSVFAHAGIPTRTKSRCGTVKNASLTSVTNILLNCCIKASTKSTWIIHLLDIDENVCLFDASPLRNSRATHLARVRHCCSRKRQSNTKRESRIISSPFGTKLLNRTSSSSEAWSNWAISSFDNCGGPWFSICCWKARSGSSFSSR